MYIIVCILQFPQVNTAIVVNIGTRAPEQTGQTSTLANSANSYMSKQCWTWSEFSVSSNTCYRFINVNYIGIYWDTNIWANSENRCFADVSPCWGDYGFLNIPVFCTQIEAAGTYEKNTGILRSDNLSYIGKLTCTVFLEGSSCFNFYLCIEKRW